MEEALRNIRVVELGQLVAAPYCGKLFSDFGAEVIKVEKPGQGDVARRIGPFPGDDPHSEKSALFLYLNTGKKSVTLDVETATGDRLLAQLLEKADVLVESFPSSFRRRMAERGFGYEALHTLNPRLIVVSISNFGANGPYRDFKANPLIEDAISGYMFLSGDPGREPLRTPGYQPEYQGGLHAFNGAMAALFSRLRTGQGQQVEIAISECMASLHQTTLIEYTNLGQVPERLGNTAKTFHPAGVYPCKDGYVWLSGRLQEWVRHLGIVLGHPDLDEHPLFGDPASRLAHAAEFDAWLIPLLKEWNKRDLAAACQELQTPVAPVFTLADLLDDPHLAERQFWTGVSHPLAGELRYPTAAFKMGESPARPGRAPLLGEHNEEIYCGQLGYDKADLARLRSAGII